MSMTKEKERQLAYIKKEFLKRVDKKFRKGAREHKESLMDIDLIEEALSECTDLLVYVLMLQLQINLKSKQ
jgi:hypothetical protein